MTEEVETPMIAEVEPSIADEAEDAAATPSTEAKSEEKGYLARDEYTSERFKLELNNLPKYFGFGVRITSNLSTDRIRFS